VVIPLLTADGRLLGVLDIDSPELNRFSEADSEGLTQLVKTLLASCQWPE
jgi:GAF domain-containing protein